MDITLEWESVNDVFDEFSPLFNAHFLEIFHKEVDVSPSFFQAIEAQGLLFLLTARDNGKPIGYYACATVPSIYNKEDIESKELGIYVQPTYREAGITTVMTEVMDKALIESGVDSLMVSYPKESSIPINAGYEIKEIVYERKI